MEYTVIESDIFKAWRLSLRDNVARAAIIRRVDRIKNGLFGDVKNGIRGTISEMRIHEGAGYRIYYTVRGKTVVFLLCGGDKKTQRADIVRAEQIAKEI